MRWREKLADWISAGEYSGVSAIAYDVIRERNVYRTTLNSIASNTCCDGCQEAARVAQKALDQWQ